jgi:hypothetical protein
MDKTGSVLLIPNKFQNIHFFENGQLIVYLYDILNL